MTRRRHYLALAGGVGGARLAFGLAQTLPPEGLSVVVNTGDDFEHLGLLICPDLDTVMYTLARINDPTRGWGVAGETWTVMEQVAALGGPDWFALGDRDLAVHLIRSAALRRETLSEVTRGLCGRLGIGHTVIPMSDSPVRTKIVTDEGLLDFQDYFVRRRCLPRFAGLELHGIDEAAPAAGFIAALDDPSLEAVILCPSNPLLSIHPIIRIPTVIERIRRSAVPVIAVSPFVGGAAVKGPAAKIFAEQGIPPTPLGLLHVYEGIVSALVVDNRDAPADPASFPIPLLITDTLIPDPSAQVRLAGEVLNFARELGDRRP